jgi:RHS repeat-associated protein
VWLRDTPMAMFTPDPANPSGEPLVYFIHSDHLNTPRVVVDRQNRVRWRWLAEPFGTSAPETNPSGLGVFTQNLRFPGQYADPESGLFYNYHRYYAAAGGSYTQSDPIGLAGGVNTYQYVAGNPNSYTDPQGLLLPMAVYLVAAWVGEAITATTATVAVASATYLIASGAEKPEVAPSISPVSSNPDLQRGIESTANYWQYKNACSDTSDINFERTLEQANAGWAKPDKCEVAKRLLDRVKQCKALREANTKKWHGGTDTKHDPQTHDDIDRRLRNADDLVRRYCKDTCQ